MLWYFHRGTLISIMYNACMNSTWLEIGGVTSWYQSRLPVGNPLPTLWSKLSLVFAKLLYWQISHTTLGLSAHVANWVILGSFSPYLYSGTLISHLFRVKDFANSNIRFSWLLLPESPPPTDDWRIHQKIQKILSDEFSSIDFREFNRPAQTSFRTWAGSR